MFQFLLQVSAQRFFTEVTKQNTIWLVTSLPTLPKTVFEDAWGWAVSRYLLGEGSFHISYLLAQLLPLLSCLV